MWRQSRQISIQQQTTTTRRAAIWDQFLIQHKVTQNRVTLFRVLRQLRHLRRYVTNDCFRSLAVSLVHSRLDYGNFMFVGLPVYLQRRLQAVLNAAARLVFRLRRYDHVTDALAILHWNGMAPSTYMNQLVPVSSLTGRRRLRSSFPLQLLVPPYRLSTVGRRSFPKYRPL